MENSKIEWCDHTFNPWEGCTKVSPGCLHCYAETRNARWNKGDSINWGKGAPRRRTSEANWQNPAKWNRETERRRIMELHSVPAGTPHDFQRPRVFCASLADWLDDEVPIQWLSDLLYLAVKCSHLDWLLLTKRPQLWKQRMLDVAALDDVGSQIAAEWLKGNPPPNFWIGTTVEDQARADERIPLLLQIPAKVRFLSCEPLLEAVNLTTIIHVNDPLYDPENLPLLNAFNGLVHHEHTCIVGPSKEGTPDGIHWVITGGESGHGCRPFNPDWARSLRDQCASAGVAYFMKQMGGTKKPFAEIPEDLMIRQFPKGEA